jgi:hypothetical protein
MQQVYRYLPLLVLFLACFVSVYAQGKHQPVSRAPGKVQTVCDIVRSPQTYVGKTIRFVGVFESPFGGPDLLSHSDCDQTLLLASFDSKDEDSIALRERIVEQLEDDGTQLLLRGDFIFSGTLLKNRVSGHTPIKGLLQNYTLIIKSAETQRKGHHR